MATFRCCVALALLISGCFAPHDPIVVTEDSGTPTSGDTSTSTASTTDASGPFTTMPASTDAMEASTTPSTESSTSETSTIDTGEPPAESSSSTGGPTGCVGVAARTVWLNFGGGTLEMGLVENAPANVTADPYQVGTWGPYADADVDELFELVQGHWAPFDVCLTREEPDLPDYDLAIVTSDTYDGNPNNPGYATIDCDDVHANNTALVVLSAEANLPTTTKAIALSKLLAKVYGLESVMATDDLMNTPIGNTLNSATFTDACHPHAGATQVCDGTPGCQATEHNSYALLAAAVGEAP